MLQCIHKNCKKNGVAGALSRRSYPQTSKKAEKPEDVIPSAATVSALSTPFEHNQATFFCKHEKCGSQQSKHPTQSNVCATDKPIETGQLQSQCQDLGSIHAYFTDVTVPSTKQERDKRISESKHYVFLDRTLYHFYQPRSKKKAQCQPILKQLAVPRCLREDVLRSYNDSLAGDILAATEHIKQFN